MTPTPPTEQLSINNIEELKQQNIAKITPEIIQDLQKVLQQKYGIDITKNIFDITKAELEDLKREIENSQNPKNVLENFLVEEYRETKGEKEQNENGSKNNAYIDTKLQTEWLWAVSLDTVTNGMNNPQLENLKTQFNEVMDTVLEKYDFLDQNRKNIFKLAIANKILAWPLAGAGKELLQSFWNLMQSLQTMDAEKLSQLAEQTTNEPKISPEASEFEKLFSKTMAPYTKWFDEIQKKLEQKPPLTPEQKQNILSHIDYFTDPRNIEKGFDKNILTLLTPDFIASHKDKKNNDKNFDKQWMKEYMTESRAKIEQTLKKMAIWGKTMDMALNMTSMDGPIWEWSKWILEFILKLPIIGKIFAMFLWLNGNDPVAELNEQTAQFKFLKELKGLWLQQPKEWNMLIEEWTPPFEWVDLSQIAFQEVKNELKILTSYKNSEMSEKDFWIQAFSETGISTKEGVNLKLKITDEQKKDKIITSKELKEIVKNWIEQQKQEVETKKATETEEERKKRETEVATQKQETEAATDRLNWEVESVSKDIKNIESKIIAIDKILNEEYEKIENWDNFNPLVWEIKNINIQDIVSLQNTWKTVFKELIWNKIWESNYEKLSDDAKKLLNDLFSYVWECAKEKHITGWSTQDFLEEKGNDFKTWLTSKKEALIKEKEAKGKTKEEKEKEQKAQQEKLDWLTKQQEKIARIEEIWEKIQWITTETSLVWDGIDVWNGERLSFDVEKQQLKIGEKEYSLSGIDAKITNITIKWDEIIFTWSKDVTLWRDTKVWVPWEKKISKQLFKTWIQEIYEKWKYSFQAWDQTINIAEIQIPQPWWVPSNTPTARIALNSPDSATDTASVPSITPAPIPASATDVAWAPAA